MFIVATDSGPEEGGARQSQPAADGMDHRGAGEIDKAELFQPASTVAQQGASPDPVASDWIHQSGGEY